MSSSVSLIINIIKGNRTCQTGLKTNKHGVLMSLSNNIIYNLTPMFHHTLIWQVQTHWQCRKTFEGKYFVACVCRHAAFTPLVTSIDGMLGK